MLQRQNRTTWTTLSIVALIAFLITTCSGTLVAATSSSYQAVADARAALSGVVLEPVEGMDSNIIPLAQEIVNQAADGVTVTIDRSSNTQISSTGYISYGYSDVSGNVTFKLTKKRNVATQTVTVMVPASGASQSPTQSQPVPSPATADGQKIAAAQAALAAAGTLTPVEGSDNSVATMAQVIVYDAAPGVYVWGLSSTNPQVSSSGAITYGSTPAYGALTIRLTSNSTVTTYDVPVAVPASKSATSVPAAAVPINIAAISGVTAPVTGATPVSSLAGNTQYSAAISWTPAASSFAAGTVYTAKITITPRTGYTLTGVTQNFFTVAGATATNIAGSGVVTAVFPATASPTAVPINISSISGVTAPVTGAIPVSSLASNTQYSAAISWTPAASSFAAGTVYTAKITITPKAGYTLAGVAQNFFKVSGATATNSANSGVVTAVFPATAAIPTGSYSVKNYGAKGDGYTDDTSAIQNAINYVNSIGGGTVYIPDGTYMINPVVSVRPKNNVNLSLSANATLKAKTVSDYYYNVINISDVSNVSVVGGKIVGERYTHPSSYGEWGSGIYIAGSNSVYIADLTVSDCFGDGVYIGETPNQNYCSNVLIERVKSTNNRRNGFAVISVKGLTVRDCLGSRMNGVQPESGMDIEPNYPSQFLQNILVENFRTEYNDAYGIEIWLGTWEGSPNPLSITIKNYSDSGSGIEGLHMGNFNHYIYDHGYRISII